MGKSRSFKEYIDDRFESEFVKAVTDFIEDEDNIRAFIKYEISVPLRLSAPRSYTQMSVTYPAVKLLLMLP